MSMGRVLVALVFLSSLLNAMTVGELEMVRTMRFLKHNADRFETFTSLIDLNALDLVRLADTTQLTFMVPNDNAFAYVGPFLNSLTSEEKAKLFEFHALLDELDYSEQVYINPELDKVTQDGKRRVVERGVSTLASLTSGQSNSYNVLALMSNFTIQVRTGINKPVVLETLRTTTHLKVYEVDQVLIPKALKHKFSAAMFPTSQVPVPAMPSPNLSNSAPVSVSFPWPLMVVAAVASLLFV